MNLDQDFSIVLLLQLQNLLISVLQTLDTFIPQSHLKFILKNGPVFCNKFEIFFQVKSRADENDKPFIIECEADGEPAPT